MWYAPVGDPTLDTVVLLHGFTLTHRTWDPVRDQIVSNHRVIMPDLPGHGRTPVSDRMSVRATSDAVADLIKSTCGRASVVGYSLGGRIGLDLACRHPDVVLALVLEGASPGIKDDSERARRRAEDDALAVEIERKGMRWFVDYWESKPLFATQRALPRKFREAIRKDRLSNNAKGLAASLRSAGPGTMKPLWESARALKLPVMIVAGELDEKFVETGVEMSLAIPRSSLAVVAGAGHCVHVERPDEFARILARFLTRGMASPRARSTRGRSR